MSVLSLTLFVFYLQFAQCQTNKTLFRIGIPSSAVDYWHLAGILNVFEKLVPGYKVEVITLGRGESRISAHKQIELHVGYQPGFSWARGLDFTNVLPVAGTEDYFCLFVRNSANISNPRDLEGKIISTVVPSLMQRFLFRLQEIFLIRKLRIWGNLTFGNFASMWNQIDGIFTPCQLYFLFQPLGARTLLSSKILGDWYSGYYSTLQVKYDFLKNHTDAVMRVSKILYLLTNSWRGFRDRSSAPSVVEEWGLNGSLSVPLINWWYGPSSVGKPSVLDALAAEFQFSERLTFPNNVMALSKSPELNEVFEQQRVLDVKLKALHPRWKSFTRSVPMWANDYGQMLLNYSQITWSEVKAAMKPQMEFLSTPAFLCPPANGSVFAAPYRINTFQNITVSHNCRYVITDAQGKGLLIHIRRFHMYDPWVIYGGAYPGTSPIPDNATRVLFGFQGARESIGPLYFNGSVTIVFPLFANRLWVANLVIPDGDFRQGIDVEFTPYDPTNASSTSTNIGGCPTSCKNGGTCQRGVCKCPPGKYGPDCSTDICYGPVTLTEDSGTIVQGKYFLDGECWFVISPTSLQNKVVVDHGIQLKINFLELEMSFDLLYLYAGRTARPSSLWANLISNNFRASELEGTVINTQLQEITLQFITDGLNFEYGGFNISYSLVPIGCSSGGCQNEGQCIDDRCVCPAGYYGANCWSPYCIGTSSYTEPQLNITSQVEDEILPLLNCSWIITPGPITPYSPSLSPLARGIEINFKNFSLEPEVDVIVISDALSGSVLREVRTTRSVCLSPGDCIQGECVHPNPNEVFGVCVCRPGFYSGDCSLKLPFVFNNVTSIQVRLLTDVSNVGFYGKLEIQYKGIYECLGNCSGRGQCILGRCFCSSDYEGADCSSKILRGEMVVSKAALIAFSVIALVVFLASMILVGFILLHKEHPVIKSSSFQIMIFIPVGCGLSMIVIPLLGLDTNTVSNLNTLHEICSTFPWILGITFVVVFSCLIAKTWRIWWLMKSADQMKVVVLTNSQLLLWSCPLMLIELIIDIVWQSAAKMEFQVVIVNDNSYYRRCSGPNYWVYFGVWVGYKAIFVLAAVVVAILARKLPSRFHESAGIGLAVYELAFIGALVLPLQQAISDNPTVRYILASVGIISCVVGIEIVIFLPKVIAVCAPNSTVLSSMGMTKTTERSALSTNSH